MKLTHREVSTLQLPTGKTDALFFDDDVPGLALRLRAGGKRSWVFQYRIGIKQRRLSLGSATALSAQEARKRAIQLYAGVKLGQDPAQEKTEAKTRAGETFGSVLPLFLSRQKARLRPRAYVEVERHLLVHAKGLHSLPLGGVTRRDIASVLSAVAAQLSGATVNRVRTSLSGFFSWAIREGLIDENSAAWTERRPEVSRERVLTDDELRQIWTALRDDHYGAIVKLLILTGCRREEIGGLHWSEVDLEQALIVLPPERVKNKRPHQVPLSPAALAVVEGRPRLTWPDGSPCDLVFGRGQKGFAGWVGSKADLDLRIVETRKATNGKPIPDWRLHDFRRTLSTTMHERLGIMPHIVEAVLGHVDGHRRGVAGVYNRATYEGEKRAALARWSEHVLAVVSDHPKARLVETR
jgi:integrase